MNAVQERVKKTFPILVWARGYNLEFALADFITGITVGLTLIPQCIAYANLAGVGPQYGLYSGLLGGIIYLAFGSAPELNIGPTALGSLLTFTFTSGVTYGNVPAAILLCFLSGVIELLCGIFHLGFLIEFISMPVAAGFTTAGALIIASAQVKNLLGLSFAAKDFISVWTNVFVHIEETKLWDAILGFSCCVVLLLLRKLKDFGAPPLDDEDQPTKTKASPIKKLIWFGSVARNAFVVITCTVIAYVMYGRDLTPFSLSAHVPNGMPTLILPFAEVHHGNQTISVWNMIKEMQAGIVVMPFICILVNVAVAKSFAKGKVVHASQEMIAIGMCNFIGSFIGSYPVNAAFSRAAVSNASGVKTPFAGIYTSIMVVLSLTFLTPYFSYIPNSTLAAVIICAVIFMVEISLTKLMWKINKITLVPFCVTVICCLFISIEVGILIGICVDFVFMLYSTARPKILFEKIIEDNFGYVKITPTSAILFPAAEYIRERIVQNKEVESFPFKTIVIDCQKVNKIDFTAANCLSAFISDSKKLQKEIYFYKPKESVAKILRSVTNNTVNIIGDDNLINAIQGKNSVIRHCSNAKEPGKD